MNEISFPHKDKLPYILFFVFSIFFLMPSIPGIKKEAMFYGEGYYTSWAFIKAILYTLPFVIFTFLVLLMICRKRVLVFDERGISNHNYMFGSLFIPWESITSVYIKQEKIKFYLCIVTNKKPKINLFRKKKNISSLRMIKMPLKNINYNVERTNEFIASNPDIAHFSPIKWHS